MLISPSIHLRPRGKKITAACLSFALVAGLPGPRAVEAALAIKAPLRNFNGMPSAGGAHLGAGAVSLQAAGQGSAILPPVAQLPQLPNLGALHGPAVFNPGQASRFMAANSAVADQPAAAVFAKAGVMSASPAVVAPVPAPASLRTEEFRDESASRIGTGSRASLQSGLRLKKEISAAGPVTAASYGAVSSVLSKFFSERPSVGASAVVAADRSRFSAGARLRPKAALPSRSFGLAASASPQDAPEFEGSGVPAAPNKVEKFPVEFFEAASAASLRLVRWEAVTAAMGTAIGVAAGISGAFTVLPSAVYVAFSLATLLQIFPRTRALIHFQNAWPLAGEKAKNARYEKLFQGESLARRAAFSGRFGAIFGLAGAGVLAWTLAASDPFVAGAVVIASLTAFPTIKAADKFSQAADLLKILLLARLRLGGETARPEDVPGSTALEKRYWFLGVNGGSVAKLAHTYRRLLASGLPISQALFTALSSHILFAQKTQKGLSEAEKKQLGLGTFDIYLPYLVQAQSLSNTRIYAGNGNAKGLRPGELDIAEFEDMFRLYASGRDYMTAADFARMRKGNSARDARDGRGNSLTRWFGELAAKRRHDQLMMLFADSVVVENGSPAPAVSRGMLLRFYQGSSQYDIMAERKF